MNQLGVAIYLVTPFYMVVDVVDVREMRRSGFTSAGIGIELDT